MGNEKKYKHFLLIGFEKIVFATLDYKNQVFFNKEFLINKIENNEKFILLESFLDKYVFEIEKKLHGHVKDINLIIDHKDFLSINLSTIQNFKNFFVHNDISSNQFMDIKNNFINHITNYEIIHMLINKFVIDGKDFSLMPNNLNCNNIFLEIKFICLKNEITHVLKKILSKYQISINEIFNLEYVQKFKSLNEDNIFNTAEKLINGLNPNEIFLTNKSPKNKGFFEKFFNLFS